MNNGLTNDTKCVIDKDGKIKHKMCSNDLKRLQSNLQRLAYDCTIDEIKTFGDDLRGVLALINQRLYVSQK